VLLLVSLVVSVLVVVSVVVDVVLVDELAIDPLSTVVVSGVGLVVTGVFRSLLVLFVMVPVPVEPVFEPAVAGVPLMSVLL